MKTTFKSLYVFLCLVLLVAVSKGGEFEDCHCTITELIRIHSPAEFTCRVDRFAGIRDLKLRISVRGVNYPDDPDQIRQLEEKLEVLLSKTNTLEITNIQDRFYFRLLADVRADGVDIREYLEKGR